VTLSRKKGDESSRFSAKRVYIDACRQVNGIGCSFVLNSVGKKEVMEDVAISR
jgi:hypothetical protein